MRTRDDAAPTIKANDLRLTLHDPAICPCGRKRGITIVHAPASDGVIENPAVVDEMIAGLQAAKLEAWPLEAP